MTIPTRLLAIPLGLLLPAVAEGATPQSAPRDEGREIVARALEKMGGADVLERTGGVVMHATGWMDKSAERQGYAYDQPSRGPFVERLAARPGGAVAYEYREDRFDGTWEELREIYPGEGRRLIVILSAGFAIDLRSPTHDLARRKLLRRLPTRLLAEVLERPDSVRRVEDAGETLRVAAALPDGTRLTLDFTRSDTLLVGASYRTDYLSFGDTDVAWRWDDYDDVEGVGALPHRYGVSVAGRAFTEMKVLRYRTGGGATASLMEVPDGIRVGEPQEITPGEEDASQNARIDTIAPGIYRVANLRGGFHPLFVRAGDGLVAIDAPGGYPMPNELPMGEIAPGPASDWLSLRYLELMEAAVPDVPVTHVVLTHFHNDHGGGLRAFVAEGATVVASAADTAEVRQYVEAPHTLAPDRLAREPAPLRMEGVDDRWMLRTEERRVEVIEVGPNPHTEGMLVVYLPDDGLMFVSDLLDPTGNPERFPSPSHASLDHWFGRWLSGSGLDPERIYTMHGSGLVTPEHLERIPPDADEASTPTVEWLVRDRPIPAGEPAVPLVEPHVAVDPEDPEHVVVGTIVVDGDRDPWRCGALTTVDGGETWSRTDFPAIDRCIDPWIVILPGDTVLATGIQIRRDAELPDRFRLLAHRSTDGGRSWSEVADTVGLGFDHPVLVADRESPSRGILLGSRRNALSEEGRVRHRISVGRLRADGSGYTETASLLPAVVGLTTTGVAPLTDGSLVVTWWDYQREVDGMGREGMLDRARAWAARSEDGGRSFGPPFLVGDHCASGGPEAAFPGYPYAEVLRTEASPDRILHACVRPGLEGIALSRSDDGGRRWSEPLRVDGGSPHVRTPMLAVNADGHVAVAWYDRRLDPEEACQDVYLAVSTDGGETFAPSRRLTTETSCPDVPGNEGVAGSWSMGGDYSSLAAAPDGTFHLVWADSRDGAFGLRHSRFRVASEAMRR